MHNLPSRNDCFHAPRLALAARHAHVLEVEAVLPHADSLPSIALTSEPAGLPFALVPLQPSSIASVTEAAQK